MEGRESTKRDRVRKSAKKRVRECENGEIPFDVRSAERGRRGCGLSPEVCSHADMHESVAPNTPNTASQFRLDGSSPFISILPGQSAWAELGEGIWPSRMKAMLRAGA